MKVIIITLLIFTHLIADENVSERTIMVNVTATVEVPADIVIFNIQLKQEDDNPQGAFNKHKDLEAKLLELLGEYNIPDSNITYSLMSINPEHRTRYGHENDEREYYFSTRQSVSLKLYDINLYSKFQIDLLSSGFYSFNSTFSSTHTEGLKEKGYAEAIKLAMEEAKLISTNMGKNLGPIVQVITETGNRFEFEQPSYLRVQQDIVTNLMDINQTVKKSTRLRVVFQVN